MKQPMHAPLASSARVLVTGMNGTVAPALARALQARGATAIAWDRAKDPPDSEPLVQDLLERLRPHWVCHVATGAPDWARWIARSCLTMNIGLLWTGSVSVFSASAITPITPDRPPCATDDYGRYKIECESIVRAENPRAIVARLGWQIGLAPGSNTMTNHLSERARAGVINASTNWTPSCAFVDDSAAAMLELMTRAEPGVFHIEGNSRGLSFFEIARGLARMLHADWRIEPADEPHFDNRMQDDRLRVGQVEARLPA